MEKLLQWLKGHHLLGRFANRRFFNYFWISATISLLNIFCLWLLIDKLGIPTILSSIMVVGGTFVGRYLLFQRFPIIS